ncbi:MAG: MFS transporter [Acidimicrobiales bacterium]
MQSDSILKPLRRPRFRRMITAQFVAETGDGITLVALPLYVFARTDSALLTSLTFAAEMTIGILLGFLGGIAADAFDRQRVLLTSYLVRGGLLVAAFAVGPLWLAVSFGILARALGQLDNPSFDALVPGQADDDLQQVLAVRRFVQAVSITIGPAVGAIAVSLIGARSALLMNAALFAVSWLILVGVKGLDADHADRAAALEGLSVTEAARDLAGGMAIAVRIRGVRRLVLYWSLGMSAVAIVMAAAIVWFERSLAVDEIWYGLAISAYGIGAAIGAAWAGGRSFSWPLPRVLLVVAPIYAAFCGVGVLFAVPWLLPLGWLCWGIALGPEMVLGELFFVRRVPEESLGRAFAGVGVANTVGMAAGYAIAGPALELWGPRSVVLGVAAFILLLGLVLWLRPAMEGAAWPDRELEPVA